MIAKVLNWGVLIAHGLFAVAVYPSLPDSVPTGLNAAGAARGMAPTSIVSWFFLWGIALGVFSMMQFIASRLDEQPELFNFSEKERLLALPVAFREPVIAEMRRFMHAVGAMTGSTMLLVQISMWRSALGERPSGLLAAVLVIAVLITPLLFLLLSRISGAVESAESAFRRTQ